MKGHDESDTKGTQDSRAADSNGQPTTEPIKVTSGAEFTEMDGAGEMMVPYGTRSRNKTASSRPNYAEDKDIENDSYDFYADKKNGDAKRPHRQTSAQGNSDAPRAANNSRKSDGNIAKLPPTSNGTHDQPTGSVLEASPAAQISNGGQTSRKRKVTTQQPQPNSDSTTTTRKSSDQLQDSQPLWKRSNLLTFDKCNARLNGGCLIADDGTRLAADGENCRSPSTSNLHSTSFNEPPSLSPNVSFAVTLMFLPPRLPSPEVSQPCQLIAIS